VFADSVYESLADEWAKGHGSGAVVTPEIASLIRPLGAALLGPLRDGERMT
jgi:hypothetical protein